MSDGTALQRSSDVLVRSFADEVLLADSAGGDVQRLEGSAAVVWELLGEPRSLAHLVEMLARVYGMPEERISADVRPVVLDLLNRGWLIEVSDVDD
jgi:hypothetical protein